MNNKKIKKGIQMFFVLLLLTFTLAGCNSQKEKNVLGTEEAKAMVENFINENLMQEGSSATIVEVVEDGDLYKVVVDIGSGENVDSYLTKDGKKFFPQALDLEAIEKEKEGAVAGDNEQKVQQEVAKNDKPKVELFVMSHCPYGTQIEKGILPVLDLLGNKIDFQLKFCDYTMHGAEELNEQINQYCIQKNEPAKLISYLTCFLGEGDSNGCLGEAGIEANTLNSCIEATKNEYQITEQNFSIFKAENTKYGITGSPALAVNETEVSSGRDSNSLLKTICSGFNNQPEECSTSLSSASPAPGFGFDGTGSNSNATCN